MKRSKSSTRSRSSARKRPTRTIDVADPGALLAYLDSTARELERQRAQLERQGETLEAIVVRLNETVQALNRIIDAGAGAGTPASAADSPVPAVVESPAPATARAPMNVRTLLPALLAKNPALAAKLEALGGCGAPHATFTMGCNACQQGAVARLAAGAGLG